MIEALQYEFVQRALIAGFLAAIACGIVGVYVVIKRIVFISGGIAHTSFGGIGLGYYLGINPVMGAMFFTLASALTMGLMVRKTRLPEDSVIGIMWAMGMALGIIFRDLAPGYTPDLFSYLFGNILTVSSSDILLMLILVAVIVSVVIALYKEFLALCFDEEYGTVIGVPVGIMYFLLLCMIALTVIVLIKVVGIILVIALLTIPATLARQFTHNLRKMMLLAVLFGEVFTFGGIWISYELEVASGATIILLSGTVLLLYYGLSLIRGRRSNAIFEDNR